MSSRKAKPFEKDARQESVFEQVNKALEPLEKELVQDLVAPRYPVIFIGGTQRSGTTLAIQLIRATFHVGYVSNLVARFWCAPYIGALLMHELQKKQRHREITFQSELGATYGYEGIHEFGFFWQRWFPYNETHQTSSEDLETIDYTFFRQELAAIESVFGVPLVFKNPIVFSLNIPALASILPTSLFIICRRDPRYVAQSTLKSRLQYHGRKEPWFSIKPKEYPRLRELPYEKQIAGQIYYTERRITKSLAKLEPHRYLILDYVELCKDPWHQMERVWDLVANTGIELDKTGFRPTTFENRNYLQIDENEFQRLEAALLEFNQEEGEI